MSNTYCARTPFRPTHTREGTYCKLQLVASIKPQEGASDPQTCGLFYSEDGSVLSCFMNEVKEIPQVERVHSYSQPVPLRVAPADGAKVWTVDPGMPRGVGSILFSVDGIRSCNLLARGELWATEDEALSAFAARMAARRPEFQTCTAPAVLNQRKEPHDGHETNQGSAHCRTGA